MQIRKASERGSVNLGWLNSKHTFSFGSYHDKNHMGFGPLRVINEDIVEPSGGFATHAHENMEIISYVVDGELQHKDSLGTGSVIVPGELQRMSAGSGITHSEYNPSEKNATHFLQIWVLPEENDISPSYEQRQFFNIDDNNFLRLIASRDGRDDSLTIHQDINIYVARINAEEKMITTNSERLYWIQVVKGQISVNQNPLSKGDGLALQNINQIELSHANQAEVLIFDMTANY